MNTHDAENEPVAGVILAGGKARRMGGRDKALIDIAGKPALDRALERLRPQASPIVINANGDAARFAGYGLPVAADTISGFAGPLAGVLTGLEWVRAHAPETRWLVSVAVDTPFFPRDLVSRLLAAVKEGGADMACAASAGRAHPVFALWPVALADDLRRAMVEEDMRKVDRWTARYRLVEVEFSAKPFDPFFNTNRPEDIATAEAAITERE